MNIVGQRLETLPAGRGGKAVFSRLQASEFVHAELCKRNIFVGRSGRLIPLNIDDNVLPAILFQMLGHIFSIFPDNIFRDGCTVTVPAVPAHRGCFGKHWIHLLQRMGILEKVYRNTGTDASEKCAFGNKEIC